MEPFISSGSGVVVTVIKSEHVTIGQ